VVAAKDYHRTLTCDRALVLSFDPVLEALLAQSAKRKRKKAKKQWAMRTNMPRLQYLSKLVRDTHAFVQKYDSKQKPDNRNKVLPDCPKLPGSVLVEISDAANQKAVSTEVGLGAARSSCNNGTLRPNLEGGEVDSMLKEQTSSCSTNKAQSARRNEQVCNTKIATVRMLELQEYQENKKVLKLRAFNLALAYLSVILFSGIFLFANFIFGVKFELHQLRMWLASIALVLTCEFILFSPLESISTWLLPKRLLLILYMIVIGITLFLISKCDDITAEAGLSDDAGNLLCESIGA